MCMICDIWTVHTTSGGGMMHHTCVHDDAWYICAGWCMIHMWDDAGMSATCPLTTRTTANVTLHVRVISLGCCKLARTLHIQRYDIIPYKDVISYKGVISSMSAIFKLHAGPPSTSKLRRSCTKLRRDRLGTDGWRQSTMMKSKFLPDQEFWAFHMSMSLPHEPSTGFYRVCRVCRPSTTSNRGFTKHARVGYMQSPSHTRLDSAQTFGYLADKVSFGCTSHSSSALVRIWYNII